KARHFVELWLREQEFEKKQIVEGGHADQVRAQEILTAPSDLDQPEQRQAQPRSHCGGLRKLGRSVATKRRRSQDEANQNDERRGPAWLRRQLFIGQGGRRREGGRSAHREPPAAREGSWSGTARNS